LTGLGGGRRQRAGIRPRRLLRGRSSRRAHLAHGSGSRHSAPAAHGGAVPLSAAASGRRRGTQRGRARRAPRASLRVPAPHGARGAPTISLPIVSWL
jgi:hypothetical protein